MIRRQFAIAAIVIDLLLIIAAAALGHGRVYLIKYVVSAFRRTY
jgi:hypothetical protein